MNCVRFALCAFVVLAISASVNAERIQLSANAEGLDAGATTPSPFRVHICWCQTPCQTPCESINSWVRDSSRQFGRQSHITFLALILIEDTTLLVCILSSVEPTLQHVSQLIRTTFRHSRPRSSSKATLSHAPFSLAVVTVQLSSK